MATSISPELAELLPLYRALPEAHHRAAQAVPGPATPLTGGPLAFHLEKEDKVAKIVARIKEINGTAGEPGECVSAGALPVTGHVVGMVKSISPELAEELRELYAELLSAHHWAARAWRSTWPLEGAALAFVMEREDKVAKIVARIKEICTAEEA